MPSALRSVRHAIKCGHVIVFFDGYCNLCNGLVTALLRADTRCVFRFAPLTGQTAKALEIDSGQPPGQTALCVVSTKGVFYGAEAVERLCERLPQPLGAFRHLALLPRRLQNLIYRFIANNRYNWFGKRKTCCQPFSTESQRFLP